MANLTLANTQATTPWSIEWGKTFGHPTNGTVTLSTKNLYLDRDISVKVPTATVEFTTNAPTATASGSVTKPTVKIEPDGSFFTDANKTTYGIVTTAPTSGTYLTINEKHTTTDNGSVVHTAEATSADVTYKTLVDGTYGSAGWLAGQSAATAYTGETVTKSTASTGIGVTYTDNFGDYYIPVVSTTAAGGELSVSKTYSDTPTVSLSASIGSLTDTTALTVADSAPAAGTYYIKIDGSTAKMTGNTTVSMSKVTESNSAGVIAAQTNAQKIAASTKDASVTVNAASASKYITIPKGSITTGSSSKTGYVNNTTAVVPANGYLYISAGYYPNTQISLGTLIPDDTNLTNAGNANLLYGYEAYDTTGTKLVGTIKEFYLGTAVPKQGETTTDDPKYTLLSSDYYTTTNTGYGVVTANTYASNTYYIKKATVSAGAASASINSTEASASSTAGINIALTTGMFTDKGTTKPTTGYFIKVDGAGRSKINTGNAGWVAEGSLTNATATKYYAMREATYTVTGNEITVNAAGFAPAGSVVTTINTVSLAASGLVADASKTSGSSAYRVTTKNSSNTYKVAGYVVDNSVVDITVYQGGYTLS